NRPPGESSKSSKSNGPPQDQRKLHIGPTIRICQLNIERISCSKCKYLERLLKKHSVDVLVLEETHIEHTQLFDTYVFSLKTANQHRPSIINVGIEIPVITSTLEPRWNFKKADWETFQKSVDTNIRWIPPTTDAFNRFIGIIKAAAKCSIPREFRKTYIPCWMEESEALYQEYSLNKNPATATAMLESLNSARRERWKSLVEETNFTHSSSLLRQLGGANPAYKHRTTIRADAIASHFIQTSKALVDKKVMQQLSTNLMAAPRSSTMSDPFTLNELNTALLATKSGKAAGPDGVYPEFLKALGPKALK
uniref:Endonuclease/exonuclease/phosphatase domain-containing protein n=1 Tax=Latimeria chalumnae TaxID=7897 RepID=H3APN3_LATCH